MRRVAFTAYGHENMVGDHRTTIELTSEDFLTPQGTCIVGIRSTMTLSSLDDDIKKMAALENTRITLRLSVAGITEVVVGWGSSGLSYSDSTSMVARTSNYECGRTLMVRADKAAANLSRELIAQLQIPNIRMDCELIFTIE